MRSEAGRLLYIRRAVHHIGRAQHPVADMTLPEHMGFQIWNGIIGSAALVNAVDHHNLETPEQYESMDGRPAMAVRNFMDDYLREILQP
jgi:hypothetical protein